jgi:biotin carboxyl carrier protein
MRDALAVGSASDVVVVPETTPIRERVVVAPCGGRFWSLPPDVFATEGEWVEPGTVLAEVHTSGGKVPVRSTFRGWVMGMLAIDGQPVKEGEALFWIRGC